MVYGVRLYFVQIAAEKCSFKETGSVFDDEYDQKNHMASAPFNAHLLYVKCPFLLRNPQIRNYYVIVLNVIYNVIP